MTSSRGSDWIGSHDGTVDHVDHDRDGPSVDERHIHHRAEHAGGRRDAGAAKPFHVAGDQWFSQLGGGGTREAGTSPAPHVGQERELGHDERTAADLHHRSVHAASIVGEDAQSDRFVGEHVDVALGVIVGDSEEDQHARLNRADDVAVDSHRGFRHSLHDGAHPSSLSSTSPQPTLAAMLTALLTTLRGFAMGAADIVPGVSGGTIALVFGIYERLIASVKAGSSALGHLVRGDLDGTRTWMGRVDWGFIVPLAIGILAAIVALAHLIEDLLVREPVLMASAFVGLVAGSVVVAWRLIRAPRAIHLGIIAAVGVAVFVLLGLTGGTTEDTVGQIDDPALWAFLGSGAIAICAMILPGVSRVRSCSWSSACTDPSSSAVTDRDFLSLAVFAVGAVHRARTVLPGPPPGAGRTAPRHRPRGPDRAHGRFGEGSVALAARCRVDRARRSGG